MIRLIVVDDEELARERLKFLLQDIPGVEVVGEAGDGNDALELADVLHPDAILLDIQMPGKTGLEVAARLKPPRPLVVFTTAYDQYAVKAFEQHAVDYLLKPVNRERLSSAINRLKKRSEKDNELSQDLNRAKRAQAHLFPRTLPKLETLNIAGLCQPARGIGGDYYDFIPLDRHRIGIALADVAGKGIAAALLMAGLQGRLQSRAPEFMEDPAILVSELNRTLCQTTESGTFVTFFYGIYDDRARRLTYVNAGHNPPFFCSSDGEMEVIERIDRGGMVLGVLTDTEFIQETIQLNRNDCLVLFTDGVTEAMNLLEEEFGEERLISVIHRNKGAGPDDLCREIRNSVLDHVSPGEFQDDFTLVIAQGS
jgi:sigma-B regulation protein RsbU (phosphoserine phosphatase)